MEKITVGKNNVTYEEKRRREKEEKKKANSE